MVRVLITLVVIVAGQLFAGDVASACTWSGAGTPLWSNPANWLDCGGGIPQNGAAIHFMGGGRPDSQNDIPGLEVAEINISGTGTGNVHYTISGLPVRVTTRVLITALPDALGAGPAFLAPLVVPGPLSLWNLAGGSHPTFGDIELQSLLTVTATSNDITIAGRISGPGSFNKFGPHSLFLDGDNTFQAASILAEGTLVARSSTALGSSGNVTYVESGASLIIASPGVFAEPLVFGTPGVDGTGTLQVAVDGVALTDVILLFSDIIVEVPASMTLAVTGSIWSSDAWQITKQGAGRLVVTSPENAWSRTIIDDGILRSEAAGAVPAGEMVIGANATFDLAGVSQVIGTLEGDGRIELGAATLTINQAAARVFTGVITGSGGLVKAGAGSLTLAGAGSNTYTGTTAVTGGALALAKQNRATAIQGPVVVEAGGSLLLQLVHEQIADTAPVTVHGAMSVNGAIETIGSLAGTGSISSAAGSLTVGANHASTIFSGSLSGYGVFRKVGGGTLTLSGASDATYEGTTELATGVLLVDGTLPSASVYGGVLGGTGSIGRVDLIGGMLDPGNPAIAPGRLSVGTLAVGATGTLALELNGAVPQVSADQVNATSVTLAGALQASLGFTPPTGTAFTIVSVSGSAPVTGTFAGLPQGATLPIGGRPFRISYTGGDGNDIVLTALAPLTLSITDVTVVEPYTGSTNAVFTVSLPQPATQTVTVQYATIDGTAVSPADYTPVSGRLTFLPGEQTQTITVAVHGDAVDEPAETFIVRLSNAQGSVAIADADGIGTIQPAVPLTWYLAEGATGSFFDTDVSIANPTSTDAPATLTFFRQDGATIVTQHVIPAHARVTVRVDDVAGLEATAASVEVKSTSGIPLIVERTMFWDQGWYGGHTGSAVDGTQTTWYFAEANQGLFDTFVLVTNPNATAATVTVTFLRENEAPFVATVPVAATSRATIVAGDFAELQGRSFAMIVEATQPVIAERAMYFGTTPVRLWSGGHESAGVTQTSTSWFHAEGATGGFFDTFILLANPGDDGAQVRLEFLTEDGDTVEVWRTVPPKGRTTVPIESLGDPRLAAGAVATVVTSDRPIISERSTYWVGETPPWGEGHNSFGLTQTALSWGLAEGRSGGDHGFATYILLANPNPSDADVTITYLREVGAPVTRTFTVAANSRVTVDVNGIVPELNGERFGARIDVTNGVPIAVERSMYWSANGVFWAGGTHATARPLH